MAMDPNKEDENSRRAAYLSPPVVGGQATLVSHRPNEEMSRTTVREEQLRRFLQPNQNSQARYGLNFMNKVKERIYTTNEVEDEFGMSIRVEIHDLSDQSIVSAGDNFLSSAKVKLTVLNAELWEIKRETWRRSEFIQTVLREREGKGPILGGNPTIQLQNGVGTFENISFNDNSSWTRNGFRLGVIFEGDGEEGYFNGERVREGVSEPFRVLDRRGEAYQKPEKLDLTESIRRIRKIGDRRASLLENKEIFNVEDFLRWYYEKEDELLKILHITSKSNKGWKIMAKHVLLSANDYQAKKNSSQPQQALVDPNKSLSTNDGPPVVGLGSSEPNPHENDIIGGDMPVPPFNGQLPAIGYIPSMYLSNEPISFASGEHIGETQPGFFPETNHANVESRNILNRDSVQPTNVGSDMAQYYEQLLAIGDIHSINFSNERIPVASGEHIGETQADLFPETNHANVEFGNILNGVDSVEPTNVGGFPQPEVSIDSSLNGLLEDSPDYNMQYSWEGYGGGGGGGGGDGGGGGYVDTYFRIRAGSGGGGGGGGGIGRGSEGGCRGGSGVQINGGRHGGRIESSRAKLLSSCRRMEEEVTGAVAGGGDGGGFYCRGRAEQINGGGHGGSIGSISPMSLIPRRSSSTSRFFRRTLSILVWMASRPRSFGFNRRSLRRRKVEVVVAEEVTVAVAGLEGLSLGEKPDVNS